MADKPMPFFVYGSLMIGGRLANHWDGLVNRIEQHLIVRGYQLWTMSGGFPYAAADDNQDKYILGELMWPAGDEAAGELTRRFDQIEGHPHHYVRTEVTVTRTSHSTEQAWMYVMNTDIKWIGQPPRRLRATFVGSSWSMWVKQHEALEREAAKTAFVRS